MALHSLTVDTARVSTGGWRGSPEVAYLVPLSSANTLTPTTLERIRTRLRDDGYLEVVTAAVGPTERDRFLTDGFVDHEHLHLLSHDLHGLHDLHDLPPASPGKAPKIQLSRSGRRDITEILSVDEATFDDFWRLDRTSLDEAIHATPAHRLRIVRGLEARKSTVVGYAVTGRAGTQGYLQRVAVAPHAQSHGIGSELVRDGLRWLHRRGASVCWVNTQVANDSAYRLYRRLGFRAAQHQLTVLRRAL